MAIDTTDGVGEPNMAGRTDEAERLAADIAALVAAGLIVLRRDAAGQLRVQVAPGVEI
jgi:hypothetical protein